MSLALKKTAASLCRVQLIVNGAVQGVGFRPFVYRLAQSLNINGSVYNDHRGVVIDAEAPSIKLSQFISRLWSEQPDSAKIKTITVEGKTLIGTEDFSIAVSTESGIPKVDIMPDLMCCDACIEEILDPNNRRYLYPFTSCTQCGPRWSIIQALPYDREKTTMAPYTLCPDCLTEYRDPNSRRFHHQANACPECGPTYSLYDNSKNLLTNQQQAIKDTIGAIKDGSIVALKGIGGFQLLIDPSNTSAINTLRSRKRRPRKPLALMCKNLQQAESLCEVSDKEGQLLKSSACPIVLLKKKPETHIAEEVAPGNPYLGIMLATSPIHYLLLEEMQAPLVVTSGNLSGEPICIDNDEAFSRLENIADLFLTHDRVIERPLDDSVAQVVLDRPMLLRRARGYAPTPIDLPRTRTDNNPTILAVGSYLKNTIATHFSNQALVGAHIGDLDNLVARNVFEERIEGLTRFYQLNPDYIAHDQHPDYPSTQYAKDSGKKCIAIQHHYAHVAACIAEHKLTDTVLGFAWDGTGLGDDETIWGGECFSANLKHYQRKASFIPFPLIGGDRSASDTRRSALSVLSVIYDKNTQKLSDNNITSLFNAQEKNVLLNMLDKNVNLTPTTSVGRLFDVVACILEVSNQNAFEGEAAMNLQFLAETFDSNTSHNIIELPIIKDNNIDRFDWRPLVQYIIEQSEAGTAHNKLAFEFHKALANCIVTYCSTDKDAKVVLSGGCFQNRLLLTLTAQALENQNIDVYWPQSIPCNDGGIAFGQLAVAQASIQH